MNGTLLHIGFDVIAWLAAGVSLLWLTRHVRFPPAPTGDLTYIAVLVLGAGVGAVLLGTANLWLSHQDGVARSIEGGIAGGIVGGAGRTGATAVGPAAGGATPAVPAGGMTRRQPASMNRGRSRRSP